MSEKCEKYTTVTGPIPLPLPVDAASVAALDGKVDDLRKEVTSSLKSFAEC